MGATRDVALNQLPIRGISINTEAGNVTAITVVPSDSGVLFVNFESSTTVEYTLPAVADAKGKWFWFFTAVAAKIKVTAPASTMYCGETTLQTSTFTASAIGEGGMCICDGTYYYFFEICGTWATS